MKTGRARPGPDRDLKKDVVKAAVEMFSEYGFSRIKMDDVAGRLGISKKTLYLNFPSKEELFSECLMATLAGWRAEYDAIIADKRMNCAEKLQQANDLIFRCYSRLNRPLADDLRRFAPKAWEAIEAWRKSIIFTELAALLEEGAKHGYFRKEADKKLGLTLYYEFSRSVLSPDFISRYQYSAEQIRAAVSGLFFGRLLTEKGRAVLKGKI